MDILNFFLEFWTFSKLQNKTREILKCLGCVSGCAGNKHCAYDALSKPDQTLRSLAAFEKSMDTMSASKRRRSITREDIGEPQIAVPDFSCKGCCSECGTITKINDRGDFSQCQKCWRIAHLKSADIMKDLNLHGTCYMVSTLHLFEIGISSEVNASLNEEHINHAFKGVFESIFTNPNDKNALDAYVLLARSHLNFTKAISKDHQKEGLHLLSMASAWMDDHIWNSIEPYRVVTDDVEDTARSAFAKICRLREIFGEMEGMGGRVLWRLVEVMSIVFVTGTGRKTKHDFVKEEFQKTAKLCWMTNPQCHVSRDLKDRLDKVIKLAELHLDLGCYKDKDRWSSALAASRQKP